MFTFVRTGDENPSVWQISDSGGNIQYGFLPGCGTVNKNVCPLMDIQGLELSRPVKCFLWKNEYERMFHGFIAGFILFRTVSYLCLSTANLPPSHPDLNTLFCHTSPLHVLLHYIHSLWGATFPPVSQLLCTCPTISSLPL